MDSVRANKGQIWTGATPKGHGRPVRPKTAGGRQTPFLTWKPREAAWDLMQLDKVFRRRRRRERERKGLCDSKGSESPMATNDSWRAPHAISDRKASRSNSGILAARLDAWTTEIMTKGNEIGWRNSKGSRSPSATIRQLEGATRHF